MPDSVTITLLVAAAIVASITSALAGPIIVGVLLAIAIVNEVLVVAANLRAGSDDGLG